MTAADAMSLVGLGIAYNKSMFATPLEWADLWKAEYKGKIAFAQYPGSEGDGILAVAACLAGKDEHDADAAFGKLAELGAPKLTYTGLDEVFALMDAGEARRGADDLGLRAGRPQELAVDRLLVPRPIRVRCWCATWCARSPTA